MAPMWDQGEVSQWRGTVVSGEPDWCWQLYNCRLQGLHVADKYPVTSNGLQAYLHCRVRDMS